MGTRPRMQRQQQFMSAYIFGAICPSKNKGAAIVSSVCNTNAMNEHLKEISHNIEDGFHAILVHDNAGWHSSLALEVPENITLLPLPPYSPELNPQEQIWQYLKDKFLKNRVFNSVKEIVDECCKSWNSFLEIPNIIRSIGTREWAQSAVC